YFTVERSMDGTDYKAVGTVDGAGTSNELKSYRFADHQPNAGRSYYRLRQTDMDGTYSFSDPVAVESNEPGRLQLFPNPAHRFFRFRPVTEVPTSFHVSIIDAFGSKKSEEFYSAVSPGKVLEYDISSLLPGVYTVLSSGPSGLHTGRIVIK
ncbi:MAG: hypothetical protein RL021_910, partial [Bacteroidota bacterium]